jgi:hypothetical protein
LITGTLMVNTVCGCGVGAIVGRAVGTTVGTTVGATVGGGAAACVGATVGSGDVVATSGDTLAPVAGRTCACAGWLVSASAAHPPPMKPAVTSNIAATSRAGRLRIDPLSVELRPFMASSKQTD